MLYGTLEKEYTGELFGIDAAVGNSLNPVITVSQFLKTTFDWDKVWSILQKQDDVGVFSFNELAEIVFI